MRFFIGCDVEGCGEGFRIEDIFVKALRGSSGLPAVIDVAAFMIAKPEDWELRADDGVIQLFCETHSAVDGTVSEPGRFPMLYGRCGVCHNTPGVICDLCGNGLGKYADPDARRALTEGRE